MGRRSEGGGGVGAALVLLLILAGAIGYNYHRNLQAETKQDRPYRGYTDEGLDQMLTAYQQRQDKQAARYSASSGRRIETREKGFYDENLREFERVQRANRKSARDRDALAGTQVVVKRIEEEQTLREGERDQVALFMKRAFTLDL